LVARIGRQKRDGLYIEVCLRKKEERGRDRAREGEIEREKERDVGDEVVGN
jgi:hypothetical protein